MSFQRKQEKDFTPEVKELVPEAEKIAAGGNLQEAIDKISALEKQTRNASDMPSTAALLQALVRITWQAGNLDQLNTQLTLMSKKHGQLKEAVVRMVDEAIPYLTELRKKKDAGVYKGKEDQWLRLLNTIRDITEGKIYLELQRARLTVLLAEYHEQLAATAPKEDPAGAAAAASTSTAEASSSTTAKDAPKKEPVTASDHLEAAADLMSDIQIETYSSMGKREKTEFILEQMRLESLRGNWPRVRVGSRKINRVFLKEPESTDLKLRYYDLIVQLALQNDNYLEVCSAYQEVWDTEEVKKDEARELNVIENIIMYIVLAAYNNEQSDMIHKLYANNDLQKAPLHYALLKCFVTKELMRWPGIEELYGPTLRQSPVFARDSTLGVKTGDNKDEDSTGPGNARWEALHNRVVEHNIRVIAAYYSRITLTRLTELLDLPALTTERTLCKLVTDKTVYARIDRPAGIVSFQRPRKTNEVLNVWSTDVGKMLSLVEKTSHLVSKEYAMHEASQAGRGKKAITA
ncbi:proteasome regulatory particle subunit [Vanrija albida]|uniref:Proteasome regulatory particle subunit n=1 Tax=Vanrija albida TaxID=181172 RepID=A0ABR3QDW0_9TREE